MVRNGDRIKPARSEPFEKRLPEIFAGDCDEVRDFFDLKIKKRSDTRTEAISRRAAVRTISEECLVYWFQELSALVVKVSVIAVQLAHWPALSCCSADGDVSVT